MNEGTVLSKALTELLLVAWICHLTSPLHALEHCLMWFSRFLRSAFVPLASFEVSSS